MNTSQAAVTLGYGGLAAIGVFMMTDPVCAQLFASCVVLVLAANKGVGRYIELADDFPKLPRTGPTRWQVAKSKLRSAIGHRYTRQGLILGDIRVRDRVRH